MLKNVTMKKSMIIFLILSLSFFFTACQSDSSRNIAYSGICSTDTFENICAWGTQSGEYYCKDTLECVNYCTFKCFNLSYEKIINASGITQKDELDSTRVYCTCICEKCV